IPRRKVDKPAFLPAAQAAIRSNPQLAVAILQEDPHLIAGQSIGGGIGLAYAVLKHIQSAARADPDGALSILVNRPDRRIEQSALLWDGVPLAVLEPGQPPAVVHANP